MSSIFKVQDVAKREIISVALQATVKDAAILMGKRNVSAVVVTDDGKPAGILTERDIVRKVAAKGLQPDRVMAKEVMSTPLVTIELSAPVNEAIELMARKNIRRLLAVENSQIAGILTQRNVLNIYRTCAHCQKIVVSPLVSHAKGVHTESFTECSCGARYHRDCVRQIVHCLNCSAQLATDVVYPAPEDTTGG